MSKSFSDMLKNIAQPPTELQYFEKLNRSEQIRRIVDECNEEVGELTDFDCPKCKNKGRIYYAIGDMWKTQECGCMKTRRGIQRIKALGVDRLMRDCTFERYKAESEYQRVMLDKAKAYYTHISAGGGKWLMLCGQSGTGKTHLAFSILAKAMFEVNITARVMLWIQQSQELKALVNSPDIYNDKIDDLQTTGLLLIDDFFNTKPSEADIKLARVILDYRYINKLPTIITSECLIGEILACDDALAGRINEMGSGYIIQVAHDDKKNYRMRGTV